MEHSLIQGSRYQYSVCSEPCNSGANRKRIKDRNCCWECVSCAKDHYVNKSDPYLCVKCPDGFIPNQHFNSCMIIPETYFAFSKPIAIILTSLSGTGISICIFVVIIFVKHRTTPIVKASSMETSGFLLSGILMSFGSVFLILGYPTFGTCLFTRIILGLSYTIGYSAMLSKLYLLDSAFSTKRMVQNSTAKSIRCPILFGGKIRPIHGRIIAISLTLLHLLSLLVWSIIEPPYVQKTLLVIRNNPRNFVICSDALGFWYLGVLVWPFLLMICCAIYAIKLRKLPSGFNETNNILVCSSISILLWVVFIPVYSFSENSILRVISLLLALLTHGSLLLVTLFLTKVYIIIFRKDKNTKNNVLASHSRTPPDGRISQSNQGLSATSIHSDVRKFSQLSQGKQTSEEMRTEMKSLNSMFLFLHASFVNIISSMSLYRWSVAYYFVLSLKV